MNTEFKIDVELTGADSTSALPICIKAGDTVFTRLLRAGSSAKDDRVLADPEQLAFWLVDNWWRLRWEGHPPGAPDPDWRLRHELSSLPSYAWPRLRIWGDSDEVWLGSLSDPPGVMGPVRYVTQALVPITALAFEKGVDDFFACVLGQPVHSDRVALRAQVDALRAERADPETALWRKLEAQAGFDVDCAPAGLMDRLLELISHFGANGVSEAVQASQGDRAADGLVQTIENTERYGAVCDFSELREAAGVTSIGRQPAWVEAEVAGRRVRENLRLPNGPIKSKDLARIVGANKGFLDSNSKRFATLDGLRYGLRIRSDKSGTERVALQSHRSTTRRFELARAAGDAVGYGDERLGPLASTKTHRQQFQRAFAQALLCPFDQLMDYLGGSSISDQQITDEDIEASAKHFLVSEKVVRTVLVNKAVIGRERIEAPVLEPF